MAFLCCPYYVQKMGYDNQCQWAYLSAFIIHFPHLFYISILSNLQEIYSTKMLTMLGIE